jgi:hypothetical protein
LGVSVAEAAASDTVELGFSTSNAPVGTEAEEEDDVAGLGLAWPEPAEEDAEILGLDVSSISRSEV